MELDNIISMASGTLGGLSISGFIAFLLPRVIKKEVAAKWCRAGVRLLFAKIDMGGQGWRATVLYVMANVVDEADKLFDVAGRYNQGGMPQ